MAIKRELIQFTIVNSTDCDYNLPLFQQNVYSVNATTKYSWDVTTADISCGTGTIVVNSVTYNLTYTATLAGLLSALNALGFGFFCSETIGGNTFIYVVDDTNVYGNLDLCPTGTTTTTTTTTAAPTTTTTTTTTTAAPTTTTTTTTTTEAPTTTTTTSTTTEAPTTTTTTSTTTEAPTTTTTTTTTTEAPTTTTTTSTTTEAPTTTTTTTTTTVEPTTSTTTTTTTVLTCLCYKITNNLGSSDTYTYTPCGTGTPVLVTIPASTSDEVCSETTPTTTGSVVIEPCTTTTNCIDNIDCLGCLPLTTTTTTTTTTEAPTTTTTTSTTTEAPTTTTTTSTTTEAPTTTTTSTTTTTTTLFENLFFDANAGAGGYTITAIDVNGVTPTLVSGTNVPFNTDGHGFNTTQTGSNQTLNLSITVVLNGCITVTDSASNVSQQNINSSGSYAFTGLVIDNTTAVQIVMADNAC